MNKLIFHTRSLAAAFLVAVMLTAGIGSALRAQQKVSSVNNPANGSGVLVSGELWESFMPPNRGPYYEETAEPLLKEMRIGNFDRLWSSPTSMWPGGWNFGAFWNKTLIVTAWDPDNTFNPATIGGVSNPSYYSSAGPNYAFAAMGNSLQGRAVAGTSDPLRNYVTETRWVDSTKRHHAIYEAGWPTTIGVDVKLTIHQYSLNWNNFNDFLIVEMTFTNTGNVDMNADGVLEKTNHLIEGLCIETSGEFMSSYSLNAGAGRGNAFLAVRGVGYIGDNDAGGSPWAAHIAFPGESAAGLKDMGIYAGPQRYTADVWSSWTWLGAKDNTGADFPTRFGTHAVGVGAERGWYITDGVGRGFSILRNEPRTNFIGSMGAFFVDGGKSLNSSLFNLAANPNLFEAGGDTLGDLRTFVLKAPGTRTAPTGDLKSTNTFAVNTYETGWTKGYTAINNFDGDGFTGTGPYKLNVGESVTLTWTEGMGFRMAGALNAISTARWLYTHHDANYDPVGFTYPAVPEMKVLNTLPGVTRLRWDNRAETDAGFAGYKIYKSSVSEPFDFLVTGMRGMDEYWRNMTPGPTPEALKRPINPNFSAQAYVAGIVGAPDGWGPYRLLAVLPKGPILTAAATTSIPGYNYAWEDTVVDVGFKYWYYLAAYTNVPITLPGYVSFDNPATTTFVETSNINRNGASGLWVNTYPFATANPFYPNTAGGLKAIGAGIQQQPIQLLVNKVISFDTVNVGNSIQVNVQIRNSSDDSLRVQVASADTVFIPLESDLRIPGGGATLLGILFKPVLVGNVSGMVTLTTNGVPARDTIRVSGFGAIPLAVEDGNQGRLPGLFALQQNFPNPFNPTTIIRYELPRGVHVTLNVYNSLGQQVAALVNGWTEAGSHEAIVDGKTLASGFYFYRLTAGDFVQTRKLLLIR